MVEPQEENPLSANLQARLVVIGASLGGIATIGDILADLPGNFPIPIAIVQHRKEHSQGLLAQVLQRRTPLVVNGARERTVLQPGCVHLAPAGFHLLIEPGGVCTLSAQAKVKFHRPSADVLFESAARVYPGGVIGVVLTGGDSDGTSGVRAIRDSGGLTIAQAPEDSEDPSMPRSAIRTGDVDLILAHTDIAQELVAIASGLRRQPVWRSTVNAGFHWSASEIL